MISRTVFLVFFNSRLTPSAWSQALVIQSAPLSLSCGQSSSCSTAANFSWQNLFAFYEHFMWYMEIKRLGLLHLNLWKDMQLFFRGLSNSQRGEIGGQNFNWDENSRLMACHYRQAITQGTTQAITYKHVMYDRFVVESRPTTMYHCLLPATVYTNKYTQFHFTVSVHGVFWMHMLVASH